MKTSITVRNRLTNIINLNSVIISSAWLESDQALSSNQSQINSNK